MRFSTNDWIYFCCDKIYIKIIIWNDLLTKFIEFIEKLLDFFLNPS